MPADPLFTVVELEAMEMAMDVIDASSLFTLPSALVASGPATPDCDTGLVTASGWLLTMWFLVSAVRMVALFAVHLSEPMTSSSSSSSWVWRMLDPRGTFAKERTIEQRGFVAARLRAGLAALTIPVDSFALVLRCVMVARGVAGVGSETAELLLKNTVAIWRHVVALRLFSQDPSAGGDGNEDGADDAAPSAARGASRARNPVAAAGRRVWRVANGKDWRTGAFLATLACVLAVVGSQVTTIGALVELRGGAAWALVALAAAALWVPCKVLVASAKVMAGRDPSGGDSAAGGFQIGRQSARERLEMQVKTVGPFFYFAVPAITWPLLYFSAGGLPVTGATGAGSGDGDASAVAAFTFTQAQVLNGMRLWAVVGWTFTQGSGQVVGYGASAMRKDVRLLESSLASEIVMDVLSGVSFFALFASLPGAGAPLESPLGRAVLAFAVLEVGLSVAHAVPRGMLRGGRDPFLASPLFLAIFRAARLLIESGAAAVRLVILFRFDGALTTVFLAKTLVGVVHSGAALWRGWWLSLHVALPPGAEASSSGDGDDEVAARLQRKLMSVPDAHAPVRGDDLVWFRIRSVTDSR